MDRKNQTEQILEYMKKHGSIDQWRAMNELHILRLGARIWDLKAAGVPIKATIKSKKSGNGTASHWAEYSLADGA